MTDVPILSPTHTHLRTVEKHTELTQVGETATGYFLGTLGSCVGLDRFCGLRYAA